MKREEYDILGLKKRAEGKSSKQITKEINNLENFGQQIKVDKKIIVKQAKQIEKLEEKIEKQNKKIFNLSLAVNSKETDENTTKNITLNDLKRIISMVKSEEGLGKKEIKEACNITHKKIGCGISFLLRNKLIEEKIKNGQKYYE